LVIFQIPAFAAIPFLTEHQFERQQAANGFATFERGGFILLKDRFLKVETAFAAPVATEDGTTEEDK
jgi:hypothetical protein